MLSKDSTSKQLGERQRHTSSKSLALGSDYISSSGNSIHWSLVLTISFQAQYGCVNSYTQRISLMHITSFVSSVKSCLDRVGSDIRKSFKILLIFFPNAITCVDRFQAPPGNSCQCSSTFPSTALHKSALRQAGENDSPGDTG